MEKNRGEKKREKEEEEEEEERKKERKKKTNSSQGVLMLSFEVLHDRVEAVKELGLFARL